MIAGSRCLILLNYPIWQHGILIYIHFSKGTQYPTTVIAPSTYNTPGQGYPQQPQYPPSGYQSTQNMTSSPPPYATAEIISASSAPSAPPSYEQSVTYPTTHIGSNTKSY